MGELKINGAAELQGELTVGELHVSGAANLTGNVHAENAKVSGGFTVSGDCNAEKFSAHGGFRIGGMLNAGSIDIAPHGDCHAREIGGETITVRGEPHMLNPIDRLFHALLNHPHLLHADTIEGDDVTLVCTCARVVRGKRLHIGPGCEIELVEYSETLELDTNAKVKEEKKI